MDVLNVEEEFDIENFEYKIKDNVIYVNHDDAVHLKQKKIVPNTYISLNLLKLILENKDFFDYAILVFSGNLKHFQIYENAESEFALRTFTPKGKIYRAFVEAFRHNLIELTDETRRKFHMLKEMNFISYYEQTHDDEIYKLTVEGKEYSFNVRDFFSLLKKEGLEFTSILKNNDEIYGVKKEYFIYALKHYFSSKFVVSNFELTPIMTSNYAIITSDTYADTYAINVFYNDASLITQVRIDKELEEYIWNGIKDDFTLLEKCIYIYLKLCKVLTYDEEYYAAHQEGSVLNKHKDMKHLTEITLENNSVVCYEFTKIYAYFLYKLGIICKRNQGEEYASGHDYVEYRCGKFIIMADPLKSIFTGDLFGVKINQMPKGFTCMNDYPGTQKEFEESLIKVFDYINCEETFEYQEVLKTYSLNDLLDNYRMFSENYKEIPFEERVSVLMEKITSLKDLKGMDVYSYIKHLGKNCFSESELNNNIYFEIVKNNKVSDPTKEVLPVGILVINNSGFGSDAYLNDYYAFSPEEGLRQVSYYVLKEYFDNKIFDSINPTKSTKIPGIGRAASL